MASTTIASFIDKIGFKVDEQSVKDVNSTAKSLKSSLTKILGTIGIAFSLTQMNAIIESYNTINKKIASAVDGLADAEETQDAILDAANECRVAYSDMAESVSDLVSANSDLFDVDSAVAYAKSITQIGKASGASDSEISSLLSSMKSSFANGKVSSSTISSLVQTMPEAAEILAESLGTTTQKLTTLASQGRISCKELRDAFLNASDEISDAFEDTNITISEAITVVKNKWSDFLVEFNDTYEITNRIAKVILRLSDGIMSALNAISTRISWLSEKLGGVENLLTLVTAAVGAFVVAFKWDSIIKGVSNFSKIFSTTTLKIFAVVAVLLVLFYLVQDFVTFMKGGKSVIGDFFESMGIDCDEVRDKINGFISNLKDGLSQAGTFISEVFGTIKTVIGSVVEFIKDHWSEIQAVFNAIGDVLQWIGGLVSGLFDIIKSAVKFVVTLIKTIVNALGSLTAVFDRIKTSVSKIGGLFSSAFGLIKDVVSDVFTFFHDKILSVIEWATSFLEGRGGQISRIFQNVVTIVTTLINLIVNNFQRAVNTMQKIWDKWGGYITSVFSAVWDIVSSIVQYVITIFTDLIAIITDLFSGNWEGLWEDVKQYFSDIWNGIANIFSTIWDSMMSCWSALGDSIKSILGDAWNNICEWFNNIVEWFTSLPEKAIQWGKDLIQGFVDGIFGGDGLVSNAVSGIAETVKNFLGFSEPEEGPLSDFHTYMPDMMDSLASGIEEGRSKVKEALEMVTGDMSAVVQAGTVSATTAGAATASSTSKTIIQYNSFNNEFNGDVAGQQKSATAMSSATDDTVSALSRAMAIG